MSSRNPYTSAGSSENPFETPQDEEFDFDLLDSLSTARKQPPARNDDESVFGLTTSGTNQGNDFASHSKDPYLQGNNESLQQFDSPAEYFDDYEDPFAAHTYVAADDRDAGAFQTDGDSRNTHGGQSGVSGLYNSVKSRLGFGHSYSGVDVPLSAQTPADAGPTQNPFVDPPIDEPPRDFDIRRIINRIRGRETQPIEHTGPREIHLNNPAANHAFGYRNNHISTTKYNVFTFLPKFLFEQFSKYANLFFLFTAIIQQVPGVSPTNRWTTFVTLAVVLVVSATKEIVEDVKRANADKELNNSIAQVLVGGEFVSKRWVNVAVGDIVRVTSEEPFPADMILLTSSEPEGLCYIETANLDGETNLKIKQASPKTCHLLSPAELSRVGGILRSEQPNSSLYTYEGTLELQQGGVTKEVALTPEQLLLRGATLRNTPWVHGVVVFTGHETKLMRNATAAPIKRTAVEHVINVQVIVLFGILVVLSLVSSLGNVVKIAVNRDHMEYLGVAGKNLAGIFFKNLLTYWILYSNLVPISLFVTIEVIKFYQAYLIGSDLDMYHKESDTPCVCRTSSLVEELGQIEYVFSDKTGTLTRNIMEFKSCSIAGRCYTSEIPEDRRAAVVDGVEVGFRSFDDLQQLRHSSGGAAAAATEFLTLLATCHTVIPEVTGESPDGTPIVKYQAASPDEGALVEGAARLGFQFTVRTPRVVTISVDGQEQQWELLNICEFNSTRKRMSAVFRAPDGTIKLFCKGADTVILERLGPENPYVAATTRHLEDFAADGLRTLCLATRIVPAEEYARWARVYERASTTLANRAAELDKAAELIEKDLFLLGATAIEDKLQDGVPETIHTLQNAGIKIWVLTGDRQETAINIGLSCKLLSEEMNLLIVNEATKEDTRRNIRSKLKAISSHDISAAEMDSLALVIDGKSLDFALSPDLELELLQLSQHCRSVICCRVSPLQKALVVKMVKKRTSSLLLAIGDGANDVSMIQAAHVGIGISGMEGMQAARAADISIGQFRYLRKLLLVHGLWSYQRLSVAILYSFYKNVALYLTQFWYVFFNAFSGQSIYESWTITFYNVFFTVAPPFVLGVFDQFVSARLLDRYPQLYRLGQQAAFFNVRAFWGWIINGVYHSIVLFFGAAGIYKYGNVQGNGLVSAQIPWGTAMFTACVLTTLGKAALVSSAWTKFTLAAIPGSFLFWLVAFPPYSVIAPLINVSKEYKGTLVQVYGSLAFWALALGLPVMCLLRDIAWKYYRRMYYPAEYHYVQEIQKYNVADYRPRMEQFQKAIRKVRQVQRMRKQRGFAFSQGDEGQEKLVRLYDTTMARGVYGELQEAS